MVEAGSRGVGGGGSMEGIYTVFPHDYRLRALLNAVSVISRLAEWS